MHNEPTKKHNRSRKAAATAMNAKAIKQMRPRKAVTAASNAAALSIGNASLKKKY